MTEYLTLVFVLVALYSVSAGRRYGHLSPISIFVYTQTVMAAGIIPSLQRGIPADVTHCYVIVGTLATLVVTAVFLSFVTQKQVRSDFDPKVDYDYPKASVWALIVLSITISCLYYMSIGYIAFFESIESIVNNTGEDIADLRLQSYSGSRYLFPGYVNQFKNSLLPALVLIVLAAAYNLRTPGRHAMAVLLVPSTLVFILGTGQRAPFVRVLVFVVIALYLLYPKRVNRILPIAALIGLPIFFLTTFATGRAAQALTQADGFGGMLGVFFEQLIFRIFGSSQIAAIAGFQYVYDQNIPAGSEWLKSIVGLLPGQSGSDTANQVFAVLYGSTRGTAPLSLWGSAYYNFGFGGAIVVALAIAAVLCVLSRSVLRKDSLNLILATGVAGVTMTMGLWISDGPTTPLNAGLGAYIILWIWGGRRAKRTDKGRLTFDGAPARASL